MQPIDLVKHQTRILPGLEEAAQTVIGRLNDSRKILKLAPLILITEPTPKQFDRELTLQRKEKQLRLDRKTRDAKATRERIREKETQTTEKKKLEEFRRKLKNGTLIERPDPQTEDWKEGSAMKPAPPSTPMSAKSIFGFNRKRRRV